MSVALNEKVKITPVYRYDKSKLYLTLARWHLTTSTLTGDGTGGTMIIQCSLPGLGTWFSGKQLLFDIQHVSYITSVAPVYTYFRIFSGELGGANTLSFQHGIAAPTGLMWNLTNTFPAFAKFNIGTGASLQIERDNVNGHTLCVSAMGYLYDEAMLP